MKKKEKEQKTNHFNNSLQLSQNIFNPNLILTDYNVFNDNDNNNKSIKMKNSQKFDSNLDSSNIVERKNNKIVVNYNCSKIHPNIVVKNMYPDYVTKTPGLIKNNKNIMEKKINDNKNKKNINFDKNMNNFTNEKILQYSCHQKEIKDFKSKLKTMKKSKSKENNSIKKKD